MTYEPQNLNQKSNNNMKIRNLQREISDLKKYIEILKTNYDDEIRDLKKDLEILKIDCVF